jgi:RNA polymerase sigma factor (sigma-70 family)
MTRPNTSLNRRYVQRLAVEHLDPGATDRELLQRFTHGQDPIAFEALVRRHGLMVLATGHRVLGSAHDAEDVFQATFLLLAQKASSQRWQPSIASWLHRTAHLLALKVRRSAARRTRHESQTPGRAPANPLAEITVEELLTILDEELLALPESLRGPLVLCYLEGATRDEAAQRLGCPLSTLKKRLERGRARLHDALARRGLSLSAALLGTVLVGQSAAAVPDALAQKTAGAAQALATGSAPGGAISSQVTQLVNGGIGMTGWNKLKAALAVVLLLGGLLAGVAVAASGVLDGKPAEPPSAPAAQPKKEEPPAPAAGVLRVVVLDPQGKPLLGANVHMGIWTDEKGFKANHDVETDAAGVARFELPKSFTIVRLWASKKPFVTMFASWERAELSSGKGLPAEYTFRLESAVTAGGRVLDEKGKPVAGAKIRVSLANEPIPAKGDGRVRYNSWLAERSDLATTDAEGRWTIANVPDHPDVMLSLLVTHPNFVTNDQWNPKAAGVTTKMFRDGTATLTLKSGAIVRGRVTDPDGKPIKDAVVIYGDNPYDSQTPCKFATDAEGRYRLPALPAGKTSLTVLVPGWAPQMRTVELKPDLLEQDFQMAPGKPARLRIVDTSGKPIPGASVYPMEWKGIKSIYHDHNPNHPKVPDVGIPRRANADGIWEWSQAPSDPVKVEVYAKGFTLLENVEVTGGASERTVTLKPEHRITGTVTDAVTGKPIPAFTIIPMNVFRKDFVDANRYRAVIEKDGRLDFLATRTENPLRLRIEAPGYRTQDGPEFRVGDGTSLKQDFRLQPSRPITGRIVDIDGRPAAKAAIFLATPTEQVRPSDDWDRRTVTDAEGRFELPDPGEPWAVVAQTTAGVVIAEFPADKAGAGTLKLHPWGSVRGRFQDGGKPVKGATVFAGPIRISDLTRPRVVFDLQITTDAEGRFEFPRVPPGPISVQVSLGPWQDEGFRSGPAVPLNLKPEDRVELELGSGGATLSGKVKLTGKLPEGLDCTYSLNYLVRREPGITPPAEVAAAGFDVRKGWRDSWYQSTEGLAYLSTLHRWFVKLAPDGTFRVSGVPAGEYDLAIAVYAKPTGCLVDPLARRVVRVTVTAADAARGELKVPEVAAEVEPIPAVGDTPSLSFTRADGKGGTLADTRGKYTVVHFWASWCGLCKKHLPALKKLQGEFAARGLAVLSLSLDDDTTTWQTALKGLELPWSQGRLGTESTSGVSGVPAYWLLDSAGKIVAKADHPDELAPILEKLLKREPADRK